MEPEPGPELDMVSDTEAVETDAEEFGGRSTDTGTGIEGCENCASSQGTVSKLDHKVIKEGLDNTQPKQEKEKEKKERKRRRESGDEECRAAK